MISKSFYWPSCIFKVYYILRDFFKQGGFPMEKTLIFQSVDEIRLKKLLRFIIPTYLTSLFTTVYTIKCTRCDQRCLSACKYSVRYRTCLCDRRKCACCSSYRWKEKWRSQPDFLGKHGCCHCHWRSCLCAYSFPVAAHPADAWCNLTVDGRL